jgi:hypothetical protein
MQKLGTEMGVWQNYPLKPQRNGNSGFRKHILWEVVSQIIRNFVIIYQPK